MRVFIIDALFVKDEELEEDKKETEVENIEFSVSFLTDPFVQDYEIIEFSKEEQLEISKLISNLNYEEEYVELAFLGSYKITFGEDEIFFDDNDDPYGLLVQGNNSKTIDIKVLKATLLKYIKEKELVNVFLYYRDNVSTTDFKRIDILTEDKATLLNIVDTIKPLQPHEYVNLMIVGQYYLIVDDTILYFDDFPGYIMKIEDNSYEMSNMSNEFIEVMKKYIVDESAECCSCCPDAKPGDVCISMCCPCN